MAAFYSCSQGEDQLVEQAYLGSLGSLYSKKPIRKWAKLQNKLQNNFKVSGRCQYLFHWSFKAGTYVFPRHASNPQLDFVPNVMAVVPGVSVMV